MEFSTVEQIFNGIGVMIDDKAEISGNPANDTLKSLRNANIPMVVYTDIPDVAVIKSLGNASFIILDWDFSSGDASILDVPEDIRNRIFPDSLRESKQHTVLQFLKTLLDCVFVPVFLITGQNFEAVKSALIEDKVYLEDKPNRIMLKTKGEITDYHSLMESVRQWLEREPSACVLKFWDSEAVLAKNRMFLDLFAASPNWVSILLRILRDDTNNREVAVNQEFLEILNNNFINRFLSTANYCAIKSDEVGRTPDDIRRVLQGERYIPYRKDMPTDGCYVGDLYYVEGDRKFPYRLNIRAQCDLSRDDNPRLYLLSGREYNQNQIIMNNKIAISDKDNRNVITINNKEYDLNDLVQDRSKQKAFNREMNSYKDTLLFSYNDIIEKKVHSIIPCVADKAFVEFHFREFEVMCKNCLDSRAVKIGRILPPYITKIQNSFTSFMIRTGLMPIPEELVNYSKK